MYTSPFKISKFNKQYNTKMIQRFIANKSKQYSKNLKRNVFFDKFIEANQTRKDCAVRYKCFLVAVDILKKSDNITEKNIKGYQCFEVIGKDCNQTTITIHLREEKDKQKNKKLYFISCFYKK